MAEPEAKSAYNHVYERLVKDPTDIVGAVAYALYKNDKREYIRQNRLSPDSDDVRQYHLRMGQQALSALRDAAAKILEARTAREVAVTYEKVLQDVGGRLERAGHSISGQITQSNAAHKTLETALAEVKTQVQNAQTHLQNTVKERTKFWSAVWSSVVGSLVLGAFFLLFLALHERGMNPFEPLLQMFRQNAQQPQATKSPSLPAPLKTEAATTVKPPLPAPKVSAEEAKASGTDAGDAARPASAAASQ